MEDKKLSVALRKEVYVSYHNPVLHGRNFAAKCGGTAWCETNIVIRSMQK